MAIIEIHAKRSRLNNTIEYVINPAKTDDGLLVRFRHCVPNAAYDMMYDTKRRCGKTDGVQGYHVIQSFMQGEVTPEQALEIGAAFAEKCFGDYAAVIATHTDKAHIHNHIVFNSVSCVNGRKYHSNYTTLNKLRAVSDELCAQYELSVIGKSIELKAVPYFEWLRQKKGLPTLRSMLAEDIKEAIEDANDFGHFLLLMEHKGYEVKFGKQLSFKPLGAERFMRGGVSEDDVKKTIEHNFDAIEQGQAPMVIQRPRYMPYKPSSKHTGFIALYYHYLYILGKIEKRTPPPKVTAGMQRALMHFEKLKEQQSFLLENSISMPKQLRDKRATLESGITTLEKRRTILNVKKKKHRELFKAVETVELYAPLRALPDGQRAPFGKELAQLDEAERAIARSGQSVPHITNVKRELYSDIANVNAVIRRARKELRLCEEIEKAAPVMERQIKRAEQPHEKSARLREWQKQR